MTSPKRIPIEIKVLGEQIKQRRLASNMTQEVAASLCGISKKTLIKIEKGGDVYVSTLLQVCQAFGIRLNLQIPQSNGVNTIGDSDDDWF